jgi:hypothetical protein
VVEALQVSIPVSFFVYVSFMFLSSALLKRWGQMLQAEVQQLRAKREAERAEREAERQRTQALEARHEGFLKFMQQLGEQKGWEIPAQLLAPPPPPPPPHHRESTPVSMSTEA